MKSFWATFIDFWRFLSGHTGHNHCPYVQYSNKIFNCQQGHRTMPPQLQLQQQADSGQHEQPQQRQRHTRISRRNYSGRRHSGKRQLVQVQHETHEANGRINPRHEVAVQQAQEDLLGLQGHERDDGRACRQRKRVCAADCGHPGTNVIKLILP